MHTVVLDKIASNAIPTYANVGKIIMHIYSGINRGNIYETRSILLRRLQTPQGCIAKKRTISLSSLDNGESPQHVRVYISKCASRIAGLML